MATTETLGFFSRLILGLLLPFRLLVDGQLAARVQRLFEAPSLDEGEGRVKQLEAEVSSLREAKASAEAEAQGAAAALAKAKAKDPQAPALQLLSVLQRDGRLVDFLKEDVTGFSDAEVGAAARLVHDGCKKSLSQYFTVEPVRKEEEGARITVEKGFDANEIRLTGNVSGEPPFKGSLAHPGWRVTDVKLPEPSSDHDLRVIAPAEVEL